MHFLFFYFIFFHFFSFCTALFCAVLCCTVLYCTVIFLIDFCCFSVVPIEHRQCTEMKLSLLSHPFILPHSHLPTYLTDFLSMHLSTHLPKHLSMYLYIYVSVHLPAYFIVSYCHLFSYPIASLSSSTTAS